MVALTIILAITAAALVLAWLPRRSGSAAPSIPAKPSSSAAVGEDETPTPKPLRGTWVVKDGQGRKLWAEELARKGIDPTAAIPLGNGYLLPEDETKHTKIIGVPGTGKSMSIKHILARVAERPEQRVVIPDPDGGYARLFYRPERGDRIVNPFDARDCGWDINADVTQPYHSAEFAAALVPENSGDGREWSHYGQQLVGATIDALKRRGDLSVESLYQTISTTPPDEYAELLVGSPAATFFRRDNERMRGSIESVVAGAIAGLRYMRNGSLSLSQYAQGDNRGWIFITYKAEQIAALKNVIATMMRVVIFALMSRPEGDSGTWLVIDELDALGKIAGLQDALQRLRKFGGRCVLAFQSLGPLVEIYGHGISSALVENCSSTLLLRSSSGATMSTSRFAAGLLGEREVLRTTWTTNKSNGSNFSLGSLARLAPSGSRNAGTGTNTTRVTEPAIIPSQIEQLPDLSGYAHSHDSPFWSRCTIEPYTGESVAEAFVPRAPESEQSQEAA